jgi:hypothetical protein
MEAMTRYETSAHCTIGKVMRTGRSAAECSGVRVCREYLKNNAPRNEIGDEHQWIMLDDGRVKKRDGTRRDRLCKE